MNKWESLNICNVISDDDYIHYGKYIHYYAKNIGPNFGYFNNWDNTEFSKFCKTNKIKQKGKKSIKVQHNHFWFTAEKPKDAKENDFTHHFLRHIRNAFAHGNIISYVKGDTEKKYYLLKDFEKNNQTMSGDIRQDLLWEMINKLTDKDLQQ